MRHHSRQLHALRPPAPPLPARRDLRTVHNVLARVALRRFASPATQIPRGARRL